MKELYCCCCLCPIVLIQITFFPIVIYISRGAERKRLGRIVEENLNLKILGEELRPMREREEVGKVSEKRGKRKMKREMKKKGRERGKKEGAKWKTIEKKEKMRERK